jgi:16S rRNA (guanine527-N7)-methyltransferase
LHSTEEKLNVGMQEIGIKRDKKLIDKLLIYIHILNKWNKKINLTAFTNDFDIVEHHFLDSLAITKFIEQKKILDVGSGAGFPGIVLALCDATRQITLVDKVGKKAAFMRQVCLELNLKNVSVIHSRVEEISSHKYDAIVARAFGDMSLLMNLTQNLINDKGVWYGMKSKKLMDEDIIKNKNIYKIFDIKVPFLDAERYLIKVSNT